MEAQHASNTIFGAKTTFYQTSSFPLSETRFLSAPRLLGAQNRPPEASGEVKMCVQKVVCFWCRFSNVFCNFWAQLGLQNRPPGVPKSDENHSKIASGDLLAPS